MSDAQNTSGKASEIFLWALLSVALFPVLHPIIRALFKNFVMSWLCKMEGLTNICSLFDVRRSLFGSFTRFVVVASLHNVALTGACLFIIHIKFKSNKQTKSTFLKAFMRTQS